MRIKIFIQLAISVGFILGFSTNAEAKFKCRDTAANLSKKESHTEKTDKKLFRATTDFYRKNFKLPSAEDLVSLTGLSKTDVTKWLRSQKNLMDRFETERPQVWESVRQDVVKAYTDFSLTRRRTPSNEEMAKHMGIELKVYEGLFGKKNLIENIEELKELAERRAPTKFKQVKDADLFDAAYDAETIELVQKHKTIIYTSIISGFPIYDVALKALIRMAEEKDAIILVRAINDEHNGLKNEALQHPRIRVLASDSLQLTPHVNLSNYAVMPKMIDPIEGAESIGDRQESLIFAAPKFRLRFLASPQNRYGSRRVMTTGTISDSNYNSGLPISRRTDKKASRQDVLGHFMGVTILEQTSGDGRVLGGVKTIDYHIRNCEFAEEFGGFFDLNKFYTAKGVVDMQPRVLVLGDMHVPVTDQSLLASLQKFIQTVRPRKIRLDDLLDGESISPHDRGRAVSQAVKARQGRNDLRAELSKIVNLVNAIHAIDPEVEIVIPPANHNNWLYRYLDDGVFLNDPLNAILGARLFAIKAQGMDPLKFALFNGAKPLITEDAKTQHTNRETLLESGLDMPHKVRFLEPGESWREGPADPELSHRLVELGFHGHEGPNGSKSLRAKLLALSMGRGVAAHTHTSEVWNGGVVVGTSTPKRANYGQDGFSNWTQTSAIVGPYGEIQLVEFRDGEWFATSTDSNIELAFPPSYPKLVSDQYNGSAEGQLDQWSSYAERKRRDTSK